MKFLGHIYCIECKVTRKWYIGQTVNTLQKRMKRHISNAQKGEKYALSRAIRKYGVENFTIEEIMWVEAETIQKLKRKLDFLECYFIARYNTIKDGYNMTGGGEGVLGLHFSEESRVKMSESARRRCDEEFRKRQSMISKKLWQSDSFRKLRSEVAHRTLSNKELQKKMGLARRGIKFTQEHKRKIGLAVAGERNGMYGKTHPKEIIAKFSKQVLQYTSEGTLVKEWDSIIDVKRSLKAGRKCLKRAIEKQDLFLGFIWKFKKV